MSKNYQWLSLTWNDFIKKSTEEITLNLKSMLKTDDLAVSGEQEGVWKIQSQVLQGILRPIIERDANLYARIIFEFPRPGEGGRRAADVILVLPSGAIAVLEFKHRPIDEFDQRHAIYDGLHLRQCHATSHDRLIQIFLLITKKEVSAENLFPGELIVETENSGYTKLREFILAHISANPDITATSIVDSWETGNYAVQPSILAGTCRALLNGEFPELTTDEGLHIAKARDQIRAIILQAKLDRKGQILIVNGAPGSGKTLLGITLIAAMHADFDGKVPVFFSGNGPLITVLKEVIRLRKEKTGSRTFDFSGIFQDAKHVKRNLKNGHPYPVLVFDESQRAWRANDKEISELESLWIWAENTQQCVVLLVGQGQAIYSREMTDQVFWNEVKRLHETYVQLPVLTCPDTAQHHKLTKSNTDRLLRLNNPIRQHGIVDFGHWINAVLNGDAPRANEISRSIKPFYPLKLFDSKEKSEKWARNYFTRLDQKDQTRFRFGWVISSQGKLANFSRQLKNGDQDIAPWFIENEKHEKSCCALKVACTEFTCQGLEIDLALLAWGNDLLMTSGLWRTNAKRETEEFTENAYRVLMSRGRRGLLIYCPNLETREYLEACGMESLLNEK
jgi:hypothetical protein